MVARLFPAMVLGNHLTWLTLRFCVCLGSGGQQGGGGGRNQAAAARAAEPGQA